MKKIFLFIGIFCCYSVFVFAQTEIPKSVITLKNGSVFTGEIIVESESTIVFKTNEGTRFQFPRNDIESIKKQNTEIRTDTTKLYKVDFVDNQAEFGIMMNTGSDYFFRTKGIGGAVSFSVDLTLGMKNIDGQNWFVGLGAGYENIFTTPENISLLKIFFKTQKFFLDKKTFSPFASLDLGYSLISNKGWEGGFFAKTKGGISIKAGQSVVFLLGLNLGFQSCTTLLEQIQNNMTYNFNGTTFLPAIGFSAGIIF
ncbi:MAG: hypothetical protein FWD66_00450 [Paludibacter sp.]|nr:hypothetical protein [Paludibacter sp.]